MECVPKVHSFFCSPMVISWLSPLALSGLLLMQYTLRTVSECFEDFFLFLSLSPNTFKSLRSFKHIYTSICTHIRAHIHTHKVHWTPTNPPVTFQFSPFIVTCKHGLHYTALSRAPLCFITSHSVFSLADLGSTPTALLNCFCGSHKLWG